MLTFCKIVSGSLYIDPFNIFIENSERMDKSIWNQDLRTFNDYRWKPCYHQVLCGVYASIYTSLCRWSGFFSHILAMRHLHTEPTHSPYQLWSIWHHVAFYLVLTLMLRKDVPGIQNSSVKALLSFTFSPFLACYHHIILCNTMLIHVQF